MKWGTEQIVRFLDIYSTHRCLWDFRDANYKNKQRRVAALEQVLRALDIDGLTVSELQTKIHSIRNTYTNELRKIQSSKTSGCGTDRVYKTKIPWFQLADSFLRDIVHRRKSYTNVEAGKPEEEVEVEGGVSDLESSVPSPLTEIVPSCSYTQTVAHNSPPKKFSKGTLQHLGNAVDALRAMRQPPEELDEIGIFCKSLAAQLRKLPEEQGVALMGQLQALVTAKRLQVLADNSHKQ